MRSWLRQHRQAIGAALRKLAAQRAAGLLHALVLGIALALPAGGYALLDGLRGAVSRAALEPGISVFLEPRAGPDAAARIAALLEADARIAGVRFVPRDAALADLTRSAGLGDIVGALDGNPLPDTFVVRARDSSAPALDALARALGALSGVAEARVDARWAQRLAALAGIGRRALAILAALLAIGLVATTFSTIRLQILMQRSEIEVSKLIGASDGFIERPFLYLGLLQGCAGGLVALGIVSGALAVLNLEVAALAESYGSAFRLPGMGLEGALAVTLGAALLGWFGAKLSVSRYLHEIQPN